jgi:hypothetical protein
MKIIYWLPRILSFIFVFFLSILSFDVFDEYSGLEAILALLIHLIPAFVVLTVTIIAYKHNLFGTVAFLALAIIYVFFIGFGKDWSLYIAVSLPALVVGMLYFINWLNERKLSSR